MGEAYASQFGPGNAADRIAIKFRSFNMGKQILTPFQYHDSAVPPLAFVELPEILWTPFR